MDPDSPATTDQRMPYLHRHLVVGVAFIVAGVWWLLHQAGLVPFDWNWAGPAALVAIGLSMLLRRGHHHC